ncbi:MAG: hypothetical protein U7126_23350 [Microcoleus sp.]
MKNWLTDLSYRQGVAIGFLDAVGDREPSKMPFSDPTFPTLDYGRQQVSHNWTD